MNNHTCFVCGITNLTGVELDAHMASTHHQWQKRATGHSLDFQAGVANERKRVLKLLDGLEDKGPWQEYVEGWNDCIDEVRERICKS